MRYPFVLLDAGGTLIGPRESFGAVYARVLHGLGFERPAHVFERSIYFALEELERAVPRGRDRYSCFPDGELGYWLRFARLAMERAIGEPVGDEHAKEALRRLRAAFREHSAWEVFPDVLPALDELRRQGVRLGIVSNWDSLLPDLLRKLGLADYFDALAVSHLEGVEKPEPALFRAALRRLGAAARETLHVGDRPEVDLAGAQAAGIDGVLIDREGNLEPPLRTLTDLSPLPELARHGLD